MTYRQYKKQQKGFTLIEMLVVLMILSLCTILFAKIAFIIHDTRIQDTQSEDEIAILQLELMLAQGMMYEVTLDGFAMRYHGEDVKFNQYEDKLVKRSGFEVFMQHLDNSTFTKENNCIYLAWKRGNKHEKRMLSCE